MDQKPILDRGILIPIIVGVFSLCGICAVLGMLRLNSKPAVVVDQTSTPFQYLFLGTEPILSTGTTEESDGEESTTSTPDVSVPTSLSTVAIPPSKTVSPNSPLLTLPAATNTRASTATPTSASTAPLGAGTYDDTHNRLVYSGDWVIQNNVAGANLNTLHVSSVLNTPGNSMTFQFIGQEIRIFYQGAPSLGTISLNLDNKVYEIGQDEDSTGINEWASPPVTAATHTVTITHIGGGSVNIDKIIIPEIPTTITPTFTATP